jgi:hypothetical protein
MAEVLTERKCARKDDAGNEQTDSRVKVILPFSVAAVVYVNLSVTNAISVPSETEATHRRMTRPAEMTPTFPNASPST